MCSFLARKTFQSTCKALSIPDGKRRERGQYATYLSKFAIVMLQQLGIKVILNLTGYVDDAPLLSFFNVYHIPIANQKPPTLHEMHQAVSIIQASVKNCQPVVVHCEAGLGRTGTIIAGYLTTCGLSAQKAIDSLRQLRPGSVETEEQEVVICGYKRIHVSRL